MAISRDEVLRIAALAQLDLTEEEIERLTHELGAILGYMEQLREVDLSAVPPTAQVLLERMPLRADEPGESLDREVVLEQAPRSRDGAFAVPTFVEG